MFRGWRFIGLIDFLVGIVCGLIVFYGQPSLAEDRAAQAQEIIENADVTYTTSFSWQCSKRTWNRVVEHPLLVGQLWEAYGYAPAYRVSMRGDAIHINDPTGLTGDVFVFRWDSGARVYLALGKLDHWAVPFFNEGMAVFVLKSRVSDRRVFGELKVYIRAASTVGNIVLQVGRSVFMKHVDNRITLNLQDVQKIAETVELTPEKVMGKLSGSTAERFERVFMH